MIDWVVLKWEKNKHLLKEYFETHKMEDYAESYSQLLKTMIDVVFNDGCYAFQDLQQNGEIDTERNFTEIDYGSCEGALIFVFAYKRFSDCLEDIFYTTVQYGSCSGCDTLLGITNECTNELPNKNQVDELMTLCLHLIQNMKCFKEF